MEKWKDGQIVDLALERVRRDLTKTRKFITNTEALIDKNTPKIPAEDKVLTTEVKKEEKQDNPI